MKNLYRIVLFVVFILIISCEENTGIVTSERALFESQQDVSILIASKVVHEFNDSLHQIIYTRDRMMYMMTNTEQTEYYSLVMNSIPELDSEVILAIEHSGLDVDFRNKKYTMTVIKDEEDKLWLWNEAELMGFLLKY